MANRPLDDFADVDHVLEALIKASAGGLPGGPVKRTVEWRVFTTIAGIAPSHHRDLIKAELSDLRKRRGVAPPLPPGAQLVDDVRWARDRYGSRFGVVAPFAAPGAATRWYLWDLDACGQTAITVYSGYHATPEDAFAEWRAGVGEFAAGDAQWVPADDIGILDEVLPRHEGFARIGGESEAQFAEFHRGQRLAELVREQIPAARHTSHGLGAEAAAEEFAAWRRAHRPDSLPDDLDGLAAELAATWRMAVKSVYDTFSPHRTAMVVSFLRDYYVDDTAKDLVALLPDWITWLAGRAGADADLLERSLAYAGGAPYPRSTTADGDIEPQARVTE